MVSQILTLLALAAAAPSTPGVGVRVEAVARATIVLGVALRPQAVVLRTSGASPAREARRDCDAPDITPRQCRLIVVDLP